LIIAKTPLRISLFGGGTDFPDYFKDNPGQVLSSSIDKYTYVILNKRPFDEKIRLGYSKTELVNYVFELDHELAREAIKLFSVSGIEMSTISDVPGGVGLATSSSILVGMLNALAVYSNVEFDVSHLIDWAINIEVNRLNKPIGYQDQIIVAKGGFQNIHFSFQYKKPYNFIANFKQDTVNKLEDSLTLFYIGGQRRSSDILSEQNKNIEKNNDTLRQMYNICDSAYDELSKGNVYDIGSMLDESWKLKKTLASNITNKEIDYVYEKALQNGSSGGKLLGAGGNGFLLFFTRDYESKENLLRFMKNHMLQVKHVPFRFDKYGSRIIFNNE
jgi:D-glycero-alpha-D-manno-heptose-7-phosphate kinase